MCDSLKEVLFEYRLMANIIVVHAIDPISQTEVTIQAPKHTDERTLQKIATNKLLYVLKKQKNAVKKKNKNLYI